MRRMRFISIMLAFTIILGSAAAASLHSVTIGTPPADRVSMQQKNTEVQMGGNNDLRISVTPDATDEAIPAIPEPASLLLVGIGIFGTGLARKFFKG